MALTAEPLNALKDRSYNLLVTCSKLLILHASNCEVPWLGMSAVARLTERSPIRASRSDAIQVFCTRLVSQLLSIALSDAWVVDGGNFVFYLSENSWRKRDVKRRRPWFVHLD
jgi:predicted ATPase